ncbi:hypothetical protein JCM4814A_02370 [Streptomyces phaeofaciens JCM 4814]|uniref:Uncharacterized protein n=1 Tax=Streptomyces phaeofaciens TaxID=68254 RepID=A0A918HPQ5_9ACTN|nr:hypothetical protein GCM10010226_83860 [Streptomyces phaeofaciens]
MRCYHEAVTHPTAKFYAAPAAPQCKRSILGGIRVQRETVRLYHEAGLRLELLHPSASRVDTTTARAAWLFACRPYERTHRRQDIGDVLHQVVGSLGGVEDDQAPPGRRQDGLHVLGTELRPAGPGARLR